MIELIIHGDTVQFHKFVLLSPFSYYSGIKSPSLVFSLHNFPFTFTHWKRIAKTTSLAGLVNHCPKNSKSFSENLHGVSAVLIVQLRLRCESTRLPSACAEWSCPAGSRAWCSSEPRRAAAGRRDRRTGTWGSSSPPSRTAGGCSRPWRAGGTPCARL